MFHLVQPWGDDKSRQATIVSTHATVAEAYAALDRIGEKLHQDEAPEGTVERATKEIWPHRGPLY